MRLADDTRGRVPFALIGVVLLLGSTTYASTLATDELRVDRDVEAAMDRATAASETALRTAVSRAARDAARTPVVEPASSNWGDVLDEDHCPRPPRSLTSRPPRRWLPRLRRHRLRSRSRRPARGATRGRRF